MRRFFSKVKGKITTLKKKSPGKRSTEESLEKESEEDEFLLEKWAVCCFNSKLVADSGQLNLVFSPVTTLSAYIALTVALPRAGRHSLKSVFALGAKQVAFFTGQLKAIPPLKMSEAFFFLRLITDKDGGLVQNSYMKMIGDYFGPYTIVSVSPPEIPRYISELTGDLLSISAARTGRTTGFCPAVVKAKWDGQADRSISAPFAVGYGKRQTQSFFPLKTPASSVSRAGFEAWSIPLTTASGRSFTLVLLRPHLTGGLLEMKKRMTADQLWDLFVALDEEEENEHCLLLPNCSVTVSDDIWARWSKNYPPFGKLKEASPMPPLHHFWHTAVFSMSSRGVGFSLAKTRPQSPKPGCLSSEGTSSTRTAYSARFDSPFFFFVNLENHITLLSGCYFGSPSPPRSSISIKLPKAIRMKAPPGSEKSKSRKSREKVKNALKRATRQRHFFRKMAAVTKRKIKSCSSRSLKMSRRLTVSGAPKPPKI